MERISAGGGRGDVPAGSGHDQGGGVRTKARLEQAGTCVLWSVPAFSLLRG